MKRIAILRGLSLASLVVVAAACSSSPDEGIGDVQGPGLSETVVFNDLDLTIVDTDEQGIPNFVVGKIGQVAIQAGAQREAVEHAMYPILEKAAPMFRMKPEEMVLSRAHTDKEGEQHFRFQQYRNGLEVLGGEMIVHVKDGIVTAVNGSARGDLEAPVDAKLQLDGAIAAVQSGALDFSEATIGQEAPLAYKRTGEALDLVYLVDVTGVRRDGTPVHDTVVVSASDGSIMARMPHIHTAKNREVHNLNGSSSLPGPVSRTEGGAAVADAVVNNNYDRLGTVWDCYKNLFGRDSFDNAGAKMISSVHYSSKYNNAYWNGTQMVYGDGDGTTLSQLANSMDVTAHELTHAVTERTSNLTYSGESGGLNEAMSDILGNTCEWYRDGQPATPSANNFLVGEDVYTPGTSGDALRYMNDPAKDGGSADYWTSSVGSLDVHYSSGVANLAFYLLAKGGTHPRGKSSINVTGIGIAKAGQIFYKADTTYMTSSTNFAGAKTATEQAATALYGAGSAELAAVTAAWQAVGVGVSGGGGGGACAHDKCSTGTALSSGCSTVVSKVCAADSYCCSTSWDSTCVQEARTIGKTLACSESNGSCSHNLCTAGTKLTSGCDSAKAACVSKVCAADSYCCASAWDSQCVSEVSTYCTGYTCN